MKPTATIILLLSLMGLAMLGCSTYTAYEYQDERELLPGPGLFSGDDGQFSLVRIPKEPPAEEAQPTESQ